MKIDLNILLQNDFFYQEVKRLSTLDKFIEQKILSRLDQNKIQYSKKYLYYLEVQPTYPILYFVINNDQDKIINKEFRIQKRIWWLIQKWKYLKNIKEKNYVFKINQNNQDFINNEFNFIYVDYNDLLNINFNVQVEVYLHILKYQIKSWDQPIWHINNNSIINDTNLGNVDIGIKKGDEKLIIDTIAKQGFLENKDGNYYPTSKLRLFSSESVNVKSTGKKVFIAMQFSNNESRFKAIKNALNSTKFSLVRADKICEPGIITNQIFKEIKNSEIVIADLSDNNNGVYYETGYAQALGKKIILLYKEGIKSVHFDVAHYRHINFKDDSDLEKQLKLWLEK